MSRVAGVGIPSSGWWWCGGRGGSGGWVGMAARGHPLPAGMSPPPTAASQGPGCVVFLLPMWSSVWFMWACQGAAPLGLLGLPKEPLGRCTQQLWSAPALVCVTTTRARATAFLDLLVQHVNEVRGLAWLVGLVNVAPLTRVGVTSMCTFPPRPSVSPLPLPVQWLVPMTAVGTVHATRWVPYHSGIAPVGTWWRPEATA